MTPSNVAWAIDRIADSRTIWDPHAGCAVLAGHGLLEHDLVEPGARPYILALIDSIIGSHPQSGNRLPDAGPPLAREDFIALLSQNDDRVRQLGHDWIYAGYILAATAAYPELGSVFVWGAVTRLLTALKQSGPGWITINGKNTVLPVPVDGDLEGPNPFTPDDVLKSFVNFDRSARAEEGDQQLGHLLTHGHAIQRLKELGHTGLADAGSRSLRARIAVLQRAHTLENEVIPFEPMSLNPREASFWKLASEKWTGDPDHLLKFAYSFLDLRRASSLSEAETSAAFCKILCSLRTRDTKAE